MSFEKELERLLNSHSMENDSDTPDFMLAQYLIGCLEVWNKTITAREQWYGRGPKEVSEPIPDYLFEIGDDFNDGG